MFELKLNLVGPLLVGTKELSPQAVDEREVAGAVGECLRCSLGFLEPE